MNKSAVIRALALTVLASLLGSAPAQTMEQKLSAETRIEIQEAAAFTDGFVIPCPDAFNPSDFHVVCVDTSETGWTAAQLRDWADYGLSHWRVFTAWTREDRYWMQTLVNFAREEMLMIFVLNDASKVVYFASSLAD